MLLGEQSRSRLEQSSVIVFGLGGVGSYAAEALARAGIGSLTLVDSDTVSLTNLNRQLYALHSTVGEFKTEAARRRIADINPDCRVTVISKFYLPENASEFPLEGYDFIADAIDTVSAKIDLAVRAEKLGVPMISCMGTGNKLDPSQFSVSDIYKTSVCPLCRVMRRELKARGVASLSVVWSPEVPLTPLSPASDSLRRGVPGSVPFVPPVAGMLMAGEIIKKLSGC